MFETRTRQSTVRVTVEARVDDATSARYHRLYRDTFGELETRAVARQLLHEEEFLEEMADERVWKIVAWDEDDEVIGLTTLTKHLETVPWISPAYFAHHYPEHTARDAVFYLGFTLVDRRHRQSRVFEAMLAEVVRRLVAERAVCGWDLCMYNEETLGLQGHIDRLLHRMSEVDIVTVDRQSYFAGTFAPLPAPD